MAREGNTLSPVIRSAWDSGNLKTMVKTAPAKATGAHISFVGHITRDELRRLLTQTESANGFANRFCWLAVKRSKCLPDGGAIHTVNFDDVVAELKMVISFAEDFVANRTRSRSKGTMAHYLSRTLRRQAWDGGRSDRPGRSAGNANQCDICVARQVPLYSTGTPRSGTRIVGILRPICEVDLWHNYRRQERRQDSTCSAARAKRADENRNQRRVFNRHASSAEIDEALRLLHGLKMVNYRTESTDGAPLQRWFYNPDTAK